MPGRPWHFSTAKTDDDGPLLAARQGEHNRAILTELGYSSAQIDALEATGVLVQPGLTPASDRAEGEA
ncbi:hypothetical protein [Streptomyces sp. NPDC051219]|uniref:hypothetical protein n=1 Tax=Streptomyces sp. NPDC051219 TaxID=3155283 RepID=UPI003447E9C9